MNDKTGTHAHVGAEKPAGRKVITATSVEVSDLIAALYDTACLLVHERETRLSIRQVCAVFERRLAVNRPTASAVLRRIQGKSEAE